MVHNSNHIDFHFGLSHWRYKDSKTLKENNMDCPFKLPVEPDEELLMLNINGKLRAALIIGNVDDWNDEKRLLYLRYIVQAINSHKEFRKLLNDSTNILTRLMQEHQIIDTDCPTTFSHRILQKLTRQRKANKQALKEKP